MSSNQLIKRNQYHGPANFQHFSASSLMDNSRLQMDLESRFVKPAPRTDKEVLIKSAAVIRRIMIPIKNRNSS
jgi:hypothetical protein